MAGPWSSRVLADYGATVVKVESRTRLDLVRILGPFYDDKFSAETSASFASINAGKRSLALDPGTPEGKATILELVDWADIVMESFSPKAMKKWGLDYASLSARKPSLIMLSTCLFGQTGPYAMMAGYGTMGAALGGLALPTGEPGRAPCGPFGPYTDYVAPRFSVVALLAALHHRDRTGEGQHIDQSQAESAMHYLSVAVAEASRSERVPRSARQHRSRDVPARRIPLRRRRPMDRHRHSRRRGLAQVRRRNRCAGTGRVAQRRRRPTACGGGRHRRADFALDRASERARTRGAPATRRRFRRTR